MLDKRFILENPDLVQENCDRRGAKVDVARFVELESQRRKLQAEVEELSRQANLVSKSIGQAKDDAEGEARKDEGRRIRESKDQIAADIERLPPPRRPRRPPRRQQGPPPRPRRRAPARLPRARPR